MIKIDCFHCQRDGTETKFVARRIHEKHETFLRTPLEFSGKAQNTYIAALVCGHPACREAQPLA